MKEIEVLYAKEAAWINNHLELIAKAKSDINKMFDDVAFKAMEGDTFIRAAYDNRVLALIIRYELEKFGYKVELVDGHKEGWWVLVISWAHLVNNERD